MKEFEVTIAVRNNLLKQRRCELGFASAASFAKRVGVSVGIYCRYEAMTASPLKRDGDWKDTAQRIADFHGLSCDELWPDAVLAVVEPSATRRASAAQMAQLAAAVQGQPSLLPERLDEALEAAQASDEALDGLERKSPVLAIVVKAYYGLDGQPPRDLEQIGRTIGKSTKRTWQLRNEALAYARHHLAREAERRKRSRPSEQSAIRRELFGDER